MKKSLYVAAIAGAMVLSFGLATAGAQESVSASEAENTDLWFVGLTGKPTFEGNSLANVQAEKARFRLAASNAGIDYTERRSFNALFNGFSVRVGSARDVAKLATLSGVAGIWPVDTIAAPNPEVIPGGSAPDLATALAMTGADIAQNTLGYTGAGIKVAVMDTGIDYNHPDLGGCFGAGCRVAVGYDFVGDAFNADPTSPTYNPVATPDSDPDDCNGHGTHVSGIIGAKGTVTGVAPDVTFGAYRVFGCAGSTTGDIMLAAMERAVADGMQVLNMSIGSSFQWPQYPTAVAADRATKNGMIVVASIGNSGASGLYSAGAPGLGEKVIGVASFDNSHVRLPYFTVNGNSIGYQTMTFSAAAPTSGGAEIVNIGRACNVDTLLADPTGKTALAVRGTCSFAEKAVKAITAGATAVVIYNNVPGVVSGTLGGPIGSGVPVVGISQADGALILAQAAPVMMNWTDQAASFPTPTGGLISSFSSYGLAPDLSLKPDIGAPGGNIYSTFPVELGSYAVLSGTSMSSPHVAGAAALLRQAKRYHKVSSIGAILRNSADPKPWFGNPALGFLDNVHRQGAGMVDVDDAILSKTIVEPSKIAAGEGQAGPFTQTLKIRNEGRSAVTYDLSYENALSTGGVITPSFTTSNASVTFSQPSVVVPPGSAEVVVTINPATAPVNGQYGGYIKLTPQDGGAALRVPFAGFVGDYQGIQVLVPTANSFPWLAQLVGASFFNRPAGANYSLVGDDIPYFLMHLEHQSQRILLEAFRVADGKPVGKVSDDGFLPRNSTSTGFFAFTWDGTTFQRKPDNLTPAPNGDYVVKVSVLKALGDRNNPAHWETWTSPVITIARP
jgi:subtilisin family serine protease